MAPTNPTTAEADAMKKRKRDKAEDRDDRNARKKHKSKSKLQYNAIGDDTGKSRVQDSTAREDEPDAEQPMVLAVSDTSPSGLGTVVQKQEAQVEGPSASWKISKPIGGRMLDIDPIFSADEE